MESLAERLKVKRGDKDTLGIWSRNLDIIELENKSLRRQLGEAGTLNKMLTNDVEEAK